VARRKREPDVSSFRALRERLLRLEEKEEEERRNEALQKVQHIAQLLKNTYRAEKVYLYGSLAWGGFDRYSDIDIYVIGLTGNYWQAYREVEAIATPIPVNVTCNEDCLEGLREKVLEKGVLI